ncbi:MAG TPA: penicillin-binding protein [Blastocatellia bacterium]|nr:penicillin-binding protein [Blastocatellia bacterium]
MGFAAFWAAAIGLRLVRLQVAEHDWLLAKAEHQQQATADILPVRGVIYDRNGREVARSIEAKSLYVTPAQVKSPPALAAKLSQILSLDRQWILGRLTMNEQNVAVKRKLTDEEVSRVDALHEPGLRFVTEQKRFYVDGQAAAQVIGYVNIDEQGEGGVEKSLDKLIRGEGGRLLEDRDALRKPYSHQIEGSVPGANVTLTIDSLIQSKAEKALADGVHAARARAGTLVIIRPATGEILAMANYPTFDPNDVYDSTGSQRCNRAIENAFEPGSVFKLVTYSAALNEGMIDQTTPIDIGPGEIKVGNHIVHDENRGVLTAAQALAKSSNVAAIKLGERIGSKRLAQYISEFGFGKRTGLDLPAESHGLVGSVGDGDATSTGSISMGYQVGVTAIQAVAAFACIANGGEYVQPYLISKVTAPDGEVLQEHKASTHRAVKPQTAAALKTMLEGVVIHGTGKLARMGAYSAAGKTGTAHKIDKVTGRYARNRYVASFAGFAPVENPQIACIVSIDEPQGRYFGGDVAAPVFAHIASEALQILGVYPDDGQAPGTLEAGLHDYEIPDLADSNGNDAAMIANDDAGGMPPGGTPAQSDAPQPANAAPRSLPLPAESTAALPAEQPPGFEVPDLRGRGLREAAEICAGLGLRLRANGEGVVSQQTPAPGSTISTGGVCTVTLARHTAAPAGGTTVAVRWRGGTAGGN